MRALAGHCRRPLALAVAALLAAAAFAALPGAGAGAVPGPSGGAGQSARTTGSEREPRSAPWCEVRGSGHSRELPTTPSPSELAGVAAGPGRDDGAAGPGQVWLPGELLVRYDPSLPPSLRRCHARALGATIVDRRVAVPGLQKLLLPPGRSVAGAAHALTRLGGRYVEYALPNLPVEVQGRVSNPTDDPLFPRLGWSDPDLADRFWWLLPGVTCVAPRIDLTCTYRGIGATDAWSITKGDPSFRLGIVDSGLEIAGGDFERRPHWWSLRKESNFSGQAGRVSYTKTADDSYVVAVDALTEVPGTCAKWQTPAAVGGRVTCGGGAAREDHGTAVAWFAAGFGNNKKFGSGVMQRAAIVPVGGVAGEGIPGGTDALAQAIDWAAGEGRAEVVNVSIAMPSDGTLEGMRLRGLYRAQMGVLLSEIMYRHPDTLFVWAAGNDGFNQDTAQYLDPRYGPYSSEYCEGARYTLQPDDPTSGRPSTETLYLNYRQDDRGRWLIGDCGGFAFAKEAPCAIRSVQFQNEVLREAPKWGGRRGNMICVAATDRTGQLAPFSNYGRRTVEFAAPGADLIGPLTGSARGRTETTQGTSFAAPLVAGVAGLVRSKYPQLSAATVKCVLMNAAARAPLPPQNIDEVSHPAFLQPQDEIVDRPLRRPEHRIKGAGRLAKDQLLRVMGIPNARYALDIAADVAADEEIGLSHECSVRAGAPAGRTQLNVWLERDGADARVRWSVNNPPRRDLARVEIDPSWIDRGRRWFDLWARDDRQAPAVRQRDGVTVQPDPLRAEGSYRFPGYRDSAKQQRVQVRVRITYSGRQDATRLVAAADPDPWLVPAASRAHWGSLGPLR